MGTITIRRSIPQVITFIFLAILSTASSFQIPNQRHRHILPVFSTTITDPNNNNNPPPSPPKAKPRKGILQSLLDFTLSSPIYPLLLVPLARKNILKTAEANGIPWSDCLSWLRSQDGPWKSPDHPGDHDRVYPDYYQRPFHAYEDGNLSWQAAFEAEIASRAIGARNFPIGRDEGEEIFRGSFETALETLGATTPEGGTIIDLGCGTGTSTRRLARKFPLAKEIIGIDLSPYFIGVGRRLLELSPRSVKTTGGTWVTTIEPDDRISLRIGDLTATNLPPSSASVVSLMLVIHELPLSAIKAAIDEAERLLVPGGQLWICEMDFDSPAYAAQRGNPLLFSLIRATEPYLDDYADGCEEMRDYLRMSFQEVRLTAATGRHYALVAIKAGQEEEGGGVIDDRRFNADGTYAVADTHLMTWESEKTETGGNP